MTVHPHWHVGEHYVIQHVPQGEAFQCDECDEEHIAYWWVHDHRYNDSTRATSRDDAIRMVAERVIEDAGIPTTEQLVAKAADRLTKHWVEQMGDEL